MFASPRPFNDTLHLFFADTLRGPWVSHPDNPIVENDRSHARCAGRIIADGDALYRLAQDSSERYGKLVNAYRVTTLSRSAYAETRVAEDPIIAGDGWGFNSHGMHHVDAHRLPDKSWVACVDGYKRVITIGFED